MNKWGAIICSPYLHWEGQEMGLNQGKESLLNIKEKFLQQPWPGRGIQAWRSLESPSVQPFRNRFNKNLSAMTDDPSWGRERLGWPREALAVFGIVEIAGAEHSRPGLGSLLELRAGGAGIWESSSCRVCAASWGFKHPDLTWVPALLRTGVHWAETGPCTWCLWCHTGLGAAELFHWHICFSKLNLSLRMSSIPLSLCQQISGVVSCLVARVKGRKWNRGVWQRRGVRILSLRGFQLCLKEIPVLLSHFYVLCSSSDHVLEWHLNKSMALRFLFHSKALLPPFSLIKMNLCLKILPCFNLGGL